jgi:hypothetical protein
MVFSQSIKAVEVRSAVPAAQLTMESARDSEKPNSVVSFFRRAAYASVPPTSSLRAA